MSEQQSSLNLEPMFAGRLARSVDQWRQSLERHQLTASLSINPAAIRSAELERSLSVVEGLLGTWMPHIMRHDVLANGTSAQN